jgi:TfoX/Sxy family transcriptional regulator of competence genes
MASDKSFVDYVTDQITNCGTITSRKMFGEYAVYCGSKVIGLICGNQFFVKQTTAGRAFIGKVTEAAAYPGAKMSFLIDRLDDREWLSELIRVTEKELPASKAKKRRDGPQCPSQPRRPQGGVSTKPEKRKQNSTACKPKSTPSV